MSPSAATAQVAFKKTRLPWCTTKEVNPKLRLDRQKKRRSISDKMPFPIKVCILCGEEFELKPDKPGFAKRCPECSVADEQTDSGSDHRMDSDERKYMEEANEARRKAMRDLLYRKES